MNGKLDACQGVKAKSRTLTGGQGCSRFNSGAEGGFLA
jgi:hypothetical protein